MQVKNLEAAKKLVKKYRSITKKDLEEAYMSGNRVGHVFEALSQITGFGDIYKCSLCTAITLYNIDYEACSFCIHNVSSNDDSKFPQCTCSTTYDAIEDANDFDELLIAIKDRADYLEKLIKKVENDN